MREKFPFRTFQPAVFSGLLDDPLMIVKVRQESRCFLVDCGQITHIAKRVLKAVDAIFISHAHMDHFIGIDSFTRTVLVSNRRITLYGPPNIAEKLAYSLKCYDWNLVEDYFCRYRVIEVYPNRLKQFHLDGAHQFELEEVGERPRAGTLIYEDDFYKVEADLCDHKIPVLIYRFTEKPVFQIDEKKIQQLGYQKGPWITQLKHWFYARSLTDTPKFIRDKHLEKGGEVDCKDLYEKIQAGDQKLSIGYVTDVGFTPENREKIYSLLSGVTLLVCECTFLKEDKHKARESFHLCTDDLNELIAELRPPFLIPLHLSKTYLGHSHDLFSEIRLPAGCTMLKLGERVTEQPLLFSDGLEAIRK